uniref:Uncharacterized protein n=1 Tax=Cynoglossus semilaevis TaxID=244447 RepID=A0A3P8W7B5_CYNSE
MPEYVSVSEFVQEVQEDWSSPTTSSFTSKMMSCRNTVYLLEEYGMVRSEVSGGEIAEELEKERRSFQLGMCEVSH